MEWLAANTGTIIASLVLIALVFFLVRSTLKNRKKGCGGCSGCSGCSGCRTSGTTSGSTSKRGIKHEIK